MLESYITPLLTSYLNKYIKNIKPSDLQLSFWGGDVVLRNLELRLDAIEEVLAGLVPFELKSGCVKQLTVHIPWTALGSEAIEVTLESVECTVKLEDLSKPHLVRARQPRHSGASVPPPETPQVSGYVKSVLNRIVNNVILRVKNLVVRVREEQCDLLLSVSVKSIDVLATGSDWKAQYVYTDYSAVEFFLFRSVMVAGMTICLDQIGSSGQVEVFEEPLVPRCALECRWKAHYHINTIVSNRFDFLFEDTHFSVTEQQFSLFLHLLDWVVTMYYSVKRRRRKDVKEQIHSDRTDDTATVSDQKSSPPKTTSLADPQSPPSPVCEEPTSTSEQGWGSWMFSFIAGPEEEDQKKESPVDQPFSLCSPQLSLGFYCRHILLDFKVTRRHTYSSFFAARNKYSGRVLQVEFAGCMAHVDDVPGSQLLGVSVGIMAVSAWISGACPCQERREGPSRGKTIETKEQVGLLPLCVW